MRKELAGNKVFPNRTKASQDILDILEEHAFSGWDTGGGCMAMRKEYSGFACIITDNDAGLDNLDEEIWIGFDDANGDPIELEGTYNNNFQHSEANDILSEIHRLESNLVNKIPNILINFYKILDTEDSCMNFMLHFDHDHASFSELEDIFECKRGTRMFLARMQDSVRQFLSSEHEWFTEVTDDHKNTGWANAQDIIDYYINRKETI